jgi:hypothetical protein
MNILELLTGTRLASWSERERHKRIIINIVDRTTINNTKKIYLLGYISAAKWPLHSLTKDLINISIFLFNRVSIDWKSRF